jgi:competence protein ComEC
VKITFKEVDQGDSIIIQWADNKIDKLGIIDCNLKEDKTNPILNELKKLSISEIEFIILSHPHTDHFSGLNELLNYCESDNIVVHRFIQTCDVSKENLLASVKGFIATTELEKLFKNIHRLYTTTIKKIYAASDSSSELQLNERWKLKFLAPTHDEKIQFINGKYTPELKPKVNASAANYLSSFIKIYSDNHHIFLTSDVVKSVFQREVDTKSVVLPTELILGQIPHHGSKENFLNYFWSKQSRAFHTDSAISVGENIYGHPSEAVIKNLTAYNYKLNLTCTQLSESSARKIREAKLIARKGSVSTAISRQDLIFDFERLFPAE